MPLSFSTNYLKTQIEHSDRIQDELVTLYTQIIQLPRVTQWEGKEVLRDTDWKYEAIRITSVIQAYAIVRRKPLSEALVQLESQGKTSAVHASSVASALGESIVSAFPTWDDDISTRSGSTSPADTRDTPITEYSASPAYSRGTSDTIDPISRGVTYYSPSAALPLHYKPRPTDLFVSSAQRPSIPSLQPNSSDFFPWPRPVISESTGPATLLEDLREALEKSDLSDCWSEMAGVLLWIALTIGAATSRKDVDKFLRRYFSALTVRVSLYLGFEHPEAMHATLLRMGQVVDGLNNKDKGGIMQRAEGPWKRGESSGKRRKM
jgi:hypothetical protein